MSRAAEVAPARKDRKETRVCLVREEALACRARKARLEQQELKETPECLEPPEHRAAPLVPSWST